MHLITLRIWSLPAIFNPILTPLPALKQEVDACPFTYDFGTDFTGQLATMTGSLAGNPLIIEASLVRPVSTLIFYEEE